MRLSLMLPLLVAACSHKGQATMPPPPDPPVLMPQHPIAIPAEPQRTGDPSAGYTALVNNGYVGCGIPYSLYSMVFGIAAASDRIPGRNGDNATLPYGQTAFTAASGVEVVTAN